MHRIQAGNPVHRIVDDDTVVRKPVDVAPVQQALKQGRSGASAGHKDACVNAGGHYQNAFGNLITVQQVDCNLTVLMNFNYEVGTVLKSGSVAGSAVKIEDFAASGWLKGQDVHFPEGKVWKKLDSAALVNVNKDGCLDLGGYYAARTGKLVAVEQVGCHALLTVTDIDTDEITTKLGTVASQDLKILDLSRTGHRDDRDGLDFGHGMRWGKLNKAAADAVSKGGCTDFHGTYNDEEGNPASVSQRGCKLQATFWSDAYHSNLTRAGHAYADSVYIKDFIENGVSSDGDIHFGDVSMWQKTDKEPKPATYEIQDCYDFSGMYLDIKGKSVVVKQKGCNMEVTLKAESLGTNIIKKGHAYKEAVRIDSFALRGKRTGSGIKFGTLAEWFLADSSATQAQFASVNTKEKVQTSAPSAHAAMDSGTQQLLAAKEEPLAAQEEAVATDKCSDVQGKYTNPRGQDVTIYQAGCVLNIAMKWDEKSGDVTKTGRIVGQDLQVQDFEKAGRVNAVGDIFFGDKAWKKKA